MSEQVRSIVEAVRGLDARQRRELTAALVNLDVSPQAASAVQKQLVDAIKGKYRRVPTTSDEFINRKREDVTLESRA